MSKFFLYNFFIFHKIIYMYRKLVLSLACAICVAFPAAAQVQKAVVTALTQAPRAAVPLTQAAGKSFTAIPAARALVPATTRALVPLNQTPQVLFPTKNIKRLPAVSVSAALTEIGGFHIYSPQTGWGLALGNGFIELLDKAPAHPILPTDVLFDFPNLLEYMEQHGYGALVMDPVTSTPKFEPTQTEETPAAPAPQEQTAQQVPLSQKVWVQTFAPGGLVGMTIFHPSQEAAAPATEQDPLKTQLKRSIWQHIAQRRAEEKQKKEHEGSRSLFAVKDIRQGEILTPDNVRSIRPGIGLHTMYYEEILGKKATKDIERGTPLQWTMIN